MSDHHAELVAALSKPGHDILKSLTPLKCHALHMGVGLIGEAGELLDAIKRWTIYEQEPDMENVIEELGDIEFYLEGVRAALGVTRERTLDHNIKKLSVRYGKRFSNAAAKERADKA
jgi:NTP pyrophosphatase (non-canonical NTP hydrolase)